jgi:hypothetical protein
MTPHDFVDVDGDGLCDFETDFAKDRPGFVERRCLQGKAGHPSRLSAALAQALPDSWSDPTESILTFPGEEKEKAGAKKCSGCGRACRKIADGSYACPSCEELEFME